MEIGDVVRGTCIYEPAGEIVGVIYCKYLASKQFGVMAAPSFVHGYCCREQDLEKVPEEMIDEKTREISEQCRARRETRL